MRCFKTCGLHRHSKEEPGQDQAGLQSPGDMSEGNRGSSDLLLYLAIQRERCRQRPHIMWTNTWLYGWCHHQGALASVSTGCSAKNMCYWGEMGSTYPEEERESLLEDVVNHTLNSWAGGWAKAGTLVYSQSAWWLSAPPKQWWMCPNHPKWFYWKGEIVVSQTAVLLYQCMPHGNYQEDLESCRLTAILLKLF